MCCIGKAHLKIMSNVVTNILTINGTDKQVAKVREFIKGSNGVRLFQLPELL